MGPIVGRAMQDGGAEAEFLWTVSSRPQLERPSIGPAPPTGRADASVLGDATPFDPSRVRSAAAAFDLAPAVLVGALQVNNGGPRRAGWTKIIPRAGLD